MTWRSALTLSLAALGCGGSQGPGAPPSPEPVVPGAAAPAPPARPLVYHVAAPLVYEVARYDTLTYPTMPGAPGISSKRAVITVRPRSGLEIEVTLDSLEMVDESRPGVPPTDSALYARWQLTLGPSGAQGSLRGGRPAIAAGQIEVVIRLLFPQLPIGGLQGTDQWTDSSTYRIRLDAFDAFETAVRSSQSGPAESGIEVDATERLLRNGTGLQAGQPMMLKGSGGRQVRYEFERGGWLDHLTARDSVDLDVTINPADPTVPVRWRSTLTARLRGPLSH